MESRASRNAGEIEKLQPVEATASDNQQSPDTTSNHGAPNRTAKDYTDALSQVLDVADIVISFVPGASAARGVAKIATKAIPIARQATNVAQKVVEANPDLADKAVAKTREAASTAAEAARKAGANAAKAAPGAFEKAGHAFGGGFGKARETLKGAAGKAAGVAGKAAGVAGAAAGAAGSVAHGAAAKVKDAAAARDEEKARREARRVVLEGAGVRLTPEKFFENWNQHAFVAQSGSSAAGAAFGASSQDAAGMSAASSVQAQGAVSAQSIAQPQAIAPASAAGYLAYPGCYVVLTFGKGVKQDDYGKFRDVFVGASSNMGAAIRADFVGLGDPDVYADVKYKQDVRVLVFPCAEENLERLRQSLIVALDADMSYNRVRG